MPPKLIWMLAPLVLTACGRNDESHAEPDQALTTVEARATLEPSAGHDANGTLYLSVTGDGVRISGEITGLEPGSTHGFHVHEKGDCSAPDASSAGGHFNPGNAPHGAPDSTQHHAGDLPNIEADAEGVATVDVVTSALQLGGGATDAVGKAFIVHAKADDYASQPSGAAGDRIACAVIASASRGTPANAP